MKRQSIRLTALLLGIVASISNAQDTANNYEPVIRQPLIESASGSLGYRILVDSVNFGNTDTRIAELTFAPGYKGSPHVHAATEIFYVLSGRFGHNVNGVDASLEAGDIGIVKPGDTVIHSVVGDEPAVVLTIWLPGGADAPFHR